MFASMEKKALMSGSGFGAVFAAKADRANVGRLMKSKPFHDERV